MIRTQISLEREEYEAARRQAQSEGISVAEFVRRALRQALPVDKSAPWMMYAGFVESGNPNSSVDHDDLIYGQKD